jgi:hypothetical protein
MKGAAIVNRRPFRFKFSVNLPDSLLNTIITVAIK